MKEFLKTSVYSTPHIQYCGLASGQDKTTQCSPPGFKVHAQALVSVCVCACADACA